MKTLGNAIALTAICTLLVACSTSTHTRLPADLIPAANEQAAFTWSATGVQIYECKANASGALAWAFVAPEAELFNAQKERVGSHGAGPHWTALDSSKTVGQVKSRTDARLSSDIPWLLLTAKSAGGPGPMAAVTSVQRINTSGGVAPSTGCAAVADVGKISRQAYTADYVYFVAR
jgi:Protein of unknown function (DUF3455)